LYVKSTYDRNKCVNEIYDKQAQSFISIENFNVGLSPEKQIPKEWIHNLGRVPVKLIQNKPFPAQFMSQVYSGSETDHSYKMCADTYRAKELKHHINATHREYLKYIIIAKPRLAIGGLTAYEMTNPKSDDRFNFNQDPFDNSVRH
jgi:hypothetical protein